MQLAPPGAAWSYNNAGFSIAGRVIEAVTGTVHQPRHARSGVHTARVWRTPARRAGDFIAHRFAPGHANARAKPADAAAAVLAVVERHGRRRRAVHDRPAGLRTLPPGRRHHRQRRARAEPRVARADAHAAAAQAEHRRRHRARRGTCDRSADPRGRRTAARWPATSCCSKSCRSGTSRSRILTNAEQRVASDSGRRARGAEGVPGRDVRDEPGDFASRAGRDAAGRRAARRAAGPRAVRRAVTGVRSIPSSSAPTAPGVRAGAAEQRASRSRRCRLRSMDRIARWSRTARIAASRSSLSATPTAR